METRHNVCCVEIPPQWQRHDPMSSFISRLNAVVGGSCLDKFSARHEEHCPKWWTSQSI
jgi:hypothetical protein